jgi:hypothetical protein
MQALGVQTDRQLASSNRIFGRLAGDAGPPVRFINLHGFTTVVGLNLNLAILLGTITRPHIITALQPICSANAGTDIAIDILISSDTLVDAAAPLRDRHLSTGTTAANGWSVYNSAHPVILNIKMLSRFTVYKLALRNNTGATITFDVNLGIQLI